MIIKLFSVGEILKEGTLSSLASETQYSPFKHNFDMPAPPALVPRENVSHTIMSENAKLIEEMRTQNVLLRSQLDEMRLANDEARKANDNLEQDALKLDMELKRSKWLGRIKSTVIAVFTVISVILSLLVALYPDEVRELIPTRYESVGQGDYYDIYNEEQSFI